MKYTKEVLEGPVKSSKSIAEVLRQLGVKQSGGTQGNIAKRIKLLGLDTSHFLGSRRNRGDEHKGGPDKLTWVVTLVKARLGHGKREAPKRLRRAMIESGIPHRCELCLLGPEWQGKVLVLQIDHINGDNTDNERNNVRFLCPNCHAQTDTFGSKNAGKLSEGNVDEIQVWVGDYELAIED